jgi:CBS domain-containing protein
MFPSAGAELRIALAGPAVSLALGVTLTAIGALLALPSGVDGVVTWLGYINLVLLGFNMLPALPLDGGRVLRASIWKATGDLTRATRIAGGIGRGAGQAMIGGGLALLLLVGAAGGLWLALIGWFLTVAAGAETRLATLREAFGELRVSDAMVRAPLTAPPDLPLDDFVDGLFWTSRHAAYPVTSNGTIVGVLPFKAVSATPQETRSILHVEDVTVPLDEALVLRSDDPLADAAVELSASRLGRALVIDDGRLAGLLSITDVSRLLELRRPAATRGRG